MSRFEELLKQPLPSQRDNAEIKTESEEEIAASVVDGDEKVTVDEQISDDIDSVSDDTTVDHDDIDDAADAGDDFDPDNMSDEELEAMDRELTGDTLDEVVGKDEPEETLTPEEEIQADDLMQTAATALLVNDELSTEEKVALINNEDEVNTIINEGFMRESDFNMLASNVGLVEEKNYNRPMIIRLDAASKKKQLYALAVNVSAAAHNDPDYRKYKKVLRLRKILKTKLERKYRTEANKRMRVYYKRLVKSASPTLNKIGAKG